MSTPEHPEPNLSDLAPPTMPPPSMPPPEMPPPTFSDDAPTLRQPTLPPPEAPRPAAAAPAARVPGTAAAPSLAPTPAKAPGPFSRTWVKVLVGVGAGVLAIGAGAGITYAMMGGGQPEAASTPVAPELTEAPEAPAPEPAPAAPEAPAQPTAQAPPAQEPEVAPEVSGLCPRATEERYVGATKDFSVRICRTPSGAYTYVGGNGELGYLQLPAALSGSSTGVYFFALNGGTGYSVEPHGLVVTPEGEASWTQEWRTGNMADISSAR